MQEMPIIKKRMTKLIFGILSALVILLALILNSTYSHEAQTKVAPELASDSSASEAASSSTSVDVLSANATITRVVDGDTATAVLDSEPDKEFKVRFLGINTPETVDPRRPVECFGKQASDFTKSQLQGKRVFLEADPMADEIDKYGRLLRNIFLTDGTDFCAELVRLGYAYAYTSFPMTESRKTELRVLQREAEEAGRGLWNEEVCVSD